MFLFADCYFLVATSSKVRGHFVLVCMLCGAGDKKDKLVQFEQRFFIGLTTESSTLRQGAAPLPVPSRHSVSSIFSFRKYGAAIPRCAGSLALQRLSQKTSTACAAGGELDCFGEALLTLG